MADAATGLEDAIAPLSLHPYGDSPGAAAVAVAEAAENVPLLGVHIDATIDWAVTASAIAPLPGRGRTRETWELLASAASIDVAGARIMEPQLDALSILAEAKAAGIEVDLATIGADPESSWGVYAAEGGRLEAHRSPDGWSLTGTKDWCSLAKDLSHALVTAWTGPRTRCLFAVPLKQAAVSPRRGPWVARGLSNIVSAPVDFDEARAVPVGDDDWYLSRAGFSWGAMGVAAVWWGSCAPVVRRVADRAAQEHADQLAQMFAGEADAAFWTMRAVLGEAADAVDAGIGGAELKITAERVRSIVAAQAERILALADRALGPAPLVTDEKHARRVSDLRVYLRQHHGERDLARLGRLLSEK